MVLLLILPFLLFDQAVPTENKSQINSNVVYIMVVRNAKKNIHRK